MAGTLAVQLAVTLPGRSLYGALEVKHLFHGIFHFFRLSFFVRLGIPFLRPDPHIVEAVARRGCQGRPSR